MSLFQKNNEELIISPLVHYHPGRVCVCVYREILTESRDFSDNIHSAEPSRHVHGLFMLCFRRAWLCALNSFISFFLLPAFVVSPIEQNNASRCLSSNTCLAALTAVGALIRSGVQPRRTFQSKTVIDTLTGWSQYGDLSQTLLCFGCFCCLNELRIAYASPTN